MDPPNPNPNLSALINPRKHRRCGSSPHLTRRPALQKNMRGKRDDPKCQVVDGPDRSPERGWVLKLSPTQSKSCRDGFVKDAKQSEPGQESTRNVLGSSGFGWGRMLAAQLRAGNLPQ
jgi:hypothetical protein